MHPYAGVFRQPTKHLCRLLTLSVTAKFHRARQFCTDASRTLPSTAPHSASEGEEGGRIEPGITSAFRSAEMDPPLGIEHLGAHHDPSVIGRLPDAAHRSIDPADDRGGYADSGQPMFAPPVQQDLQLPPVLQAHVSSVPIILRSDHQGSRVSKHVGSSAKEHKRASSSSEGRASKKQRAAQQQAAAQSVVLTTSETLLGTGLAASAHSDISLSERTSTSMAPQFQHPHDLHQNCLLQTPRIFPTCGPGLIHALHISLILRRKCTLPRVFSFCFSFFHSDAMSCATLYLSLC